jgi:flavodoxin
VPSGGPSGNAAGGVLLAYFSRAGENYHYGGRRDLAVGNTQVVAELIGRLTGCDVHRIEAADPYPDDYEETRARNVREQDDDARPAIANPLPAVANYRTVLLGSPIWSVRTPLIMTTFTEGLDLRGKTVHPLVTYAVSGIGNAERNYAEACPGATIGESLAVRGEEVADGDPGVQPAVESWLRRIRLLR